MIEIVSTDITVPSGMNEEICYENIRSYKSPIALSERNGINGYMTSFFSDEDINEIEFEGDFSFFEKVLIRSIKKSLDKTSIDMTSQKVFIIISSTKGNILPLEAYIAMHSFSDYSHNSISFEKCRREINLPLSAKRVADFFHIPNEPIVVSNACISGLHAQILAKSLLDTGVYDYIIVAGCDLLSQFILSGFNTLKVVSKEACRPFDIDRKGLNLGEGAGTMIFKRADSYVTGKWYALSGAVRNDAYHITSPSPDASGLSEAIFHTLNGYDKEMIGFINAHGTSTMYNDEMEARAIANMGLESIPVNSLKGYLGHTMGASGIVETIISIMAINDNTILGTRGFEENGVSVRLNISKENRKTTKTSFLKIISGFGGCNAAMLYTKGK